MVINVCKKEDGDLTADDYPKMMTSPALNLVSLGREEQVLVCQHSVLEDYHHLTTVGSTSWKDRNSECLL